DFPPRPRSPTRSTCCECPIQCSTLSRLLLLLFGVPHRMTPWFPANLIAVCGGADRLIDTTSDANAGYPQQPGMSCANISGVGGWVVSCSSSGGSPNGPMMNCESRSSPVAACQSGMELYCVSSHQNGSGSLANR